MNCNNSSFLTSDFDIENYKHYYLIESDFNLHEKYTGPNTQKWYHSSEPLEEQSLDD